MEKPKLLIDEYESMAEKSLIRVQYSCGGNSTSVDKTNYIPIVNNQANINNKVEYLTANEDDVKPLIDLLKYYNLPVKDLSTGNRHFVVAKISNVVVGVVAVELYGEFGLLRSLAVSKDYTSFGIGKKLVENALGWSFGYELKKLFLLTTSAVQFFEKLGWEIIERSEVPEIILNSPEFKSICPSTAVSMTKNL